MTIGSILSRSADDKIILHNVASFRTEENFVGPIVARIGCQ